MSPPPTDVIQARERLACDSHESMSPPPTDVIQEQECLACDPPHESMPPPPTGVLARSSATAGQCQLLVAKSVAHCFLANAVSSTLLRIQISIWLPSANAGLAILKTEHFKALAAFAASPFLIEGM